MITEILYALKKVNNALEMIESKNINIAIKELSLLRNSLRNDVLQGTSTLN